MVHACLRFAQDLFVMDACFTPPASHCWTWSLGFILFTILCLSVGLRNSNAPESALSTFAMLSTATRSASASLGGASRGSSSVETAPLRHGQWEGILVSYERTFGSISGLCTEMQFRSYIL